MPEFFDNIYWLLLLIPAIYLGIPLMIRFQQKMQAHPALEELDFDRLSPSISQFLMNQTKTLYALGFDEPTLVQLPKPVTNVTTYLVMLVNRNAGDKAMVTAVLGHGPAPLQTCQVEFSTRFDTGEVFDTHNAPILMAFPPLPRAIRTQVPILKDLQKLYALHNYVMSKHAPKGMKFLYDPGTALDYLTQFTFIKSYDGQVQRGLLYFDQGEDVYRFTVKGAYLVTWGLMQPIKAMRFAALHKRARTILEEFEHVRAS
jgi:hypothetical protein